MLRSMIKLALVIFFFAISINSQTITSYGLKLGSEASNPIWKVGSQSFDGVETKLGIDVGLFIEWGLTTDASFLTEMHYIQKGLRFYQPAVQFYANTTDFSVTLNSITPIVNYLSFPLLIKYDLIHSDVVPYIICGLRVDFALSKNEIQEARWLYKDVNKVDLGGCIGVGFQTKALLGFGTGLELKYSPSFTKVSSSLEGDITNRSFEINLILYR